MKKESHIYVDTSPNDDQLDSDMAYLFNDNSTIKYRNHAMINSSLVKNVSDVDNSGNSSSNVGVDASADDRPGDDETMKYVVPGLAGLRNLGNTCYMNAALQAFINSCPHIATYLMKTEYYEDRLIANCILKLAKENREKEKKDESEQVKISKTELNKQKINSLTYQLGRLFRHMYNKNATYSPKAIKKIIGRLNDEFIGFNQNDSQELVVALLDAIHEETKASVNLKFVDIPQDMKEYIKIRNECSAKMDDDSLSLEEREGAKNKHSEYLKKNPDSVVKLKGYLRWKELIKDSHSIITDLFTGIECSVVECMECKTKSRSFNKFTSIAIETAQTGTTTLEQCLKDYSREETLTGDNKYNCEKCDKYTDAKKNIYIWRPPETLVITLKRFKHDYVVYNNKYKQSTTKTHSTVSFPLSDLELSENYTRTSQDTDSKYSLNSIVLHKGQANFGHYIAYGKNSINNEWYEFDDSRVVHIPKGEIEGEVVTKDAYVLIYQRNH
jgi:ubiquitin C-terminal hydrolase